MTNRKILIADNHPLYRLGLKLALTGMLAGTDIVEAGSFEAVARVLDGADDIDLVLVDLEMPDIPGCPVLRAIRTRYPTLPFLVMSEHEGPAAIAMAHACGATGVIAKSATTDVVRRSIAEALRGSLRLPPCPGPAPAHDEAQAIAERLSTLSLREAHVLVFVCKGLSNREIAEELSVANSTVKAHVSSILLKLEADCRTQAVVYANKVKTLEWVADDATCEESAIRRTSVAAKGSRFPATEPGPRADLRGGAVSP